MRHDALYLQGLLRSAEERICLTRLNLSGLAVLTEASTGAYGLTPVIAALAGAREVLAYARDSSFGKVDDVRRETALLMQSAGRPLPITVVSKLSLEDYARFDIISNSGHLRPITREHVFAMKSTAVIPLMYEGWELRRGDLDLAACRERGIRHAGTNEHHAVLQVFDFLGPLVIKALQRFFVPVLGSRIAVISNNAFAGPVARFLGQNGAEVICIGPESCFAGLGFARLYGELPGANIDQGIDACVVATTPSVSGEKRYTKEVVTASIVHALPATCIHLWGDIDYPRLRQAGVVVVPEVAVAEGHQGLVMSDAGPEPVIRLITGGMKVGEVLAKGYQDAAELAFCQFLPEEEPQK